MKTAVDAPQNPVAVLRAIHGSDASLGVFLAGEGDIDADRLLVLSILAGFADDDLDDLAVLSEVVRTAERVEQAVFPYRGGQAGYVYEVLLDNTQAGEVLAAERVGLSLLGLLLAHLGVLLGFLRNLLLVLGHPGSC